MLRARRAGFKGWWWIWVCRDLDATSKRDFTHAFSCNGLASLHCLAAWLLVTQHTVKGSWGNPVSGVSKCGFYCEGPGHASLTLKSYQIQRSNSFDTTDITTCTLQRHWISKRALCRIYLSIILKPWPESSRKRSQLLPKMDMHTLLWYCLCTPQESHDIESISSSSSGLAPYIRAWYVSLSGVAAPRLVTSRVYKGRVAVVQPRTFTIATHAPPNTHTVPLPSEQVDDQIDHGPCCLRGMVYYPSPQLNAFFSEQKTTMPISVAPNSLHPRDHHVAEPSIEPLVEGDRGTALGSYRYYGKKRTGAIDEVNRDLSTLLIGAEVAHLPIYSACPK